MLRLERIGRLTAYAILAAIMIIGASFAGIIDLKPPAIDAAIDTPAGFRVTPDKDARTVLLERRVAWLLILLSIGAMVILVASRRRITNATLDVAAKGLHASRRLRRGARDVAKEVDRRSRS